jgi:hypothetical protein
MIVCPHLECWCDGRVLPPEEVEALSPTTGAGSRPRVFVAMYPEIELDDGHSQREPGPEAIDS